MMDDVVDDHPRSYEEVRHLPNLRGWNYNANRRAPLSFRERIEYMRHGFISSAVDIPVCDSGEGCARYWCCIENASRWFAWCTHHCEDCNTGVTRPRTDFDIELVIEDSVRSLWTPDLCFGGIDEIDDLLRAHSDHRLRATRPDPPHYNGFHAVLKNAGF